MADPARGAVLSRAERRARARRRIGTALLAYGVAGLLLLVPASIVVARLGVPAGTDPRADLLAALDSSRSALHDARVAAGQAGDGLGSAGHAAGSAGTFMTDLSTTMRNLAATLRSPIPLVGAPFASTGDEFDALAGRSDAVANDLRTVETSVGSGAADLTTLSVTLTRVETDMGRIRTSLDELGVGDLGTVRLLGLALLAWLAVPALVSLVVGWRLVRRPGRPASARATARSTAVESWRSGRPGSGEA